MKKEERSVNQKQSTGDGSVAVQASGDVHVGVSASEARQIAQDVAQLELNRLAGSAAETAAKRAEELVNTLLGDEKENVELLSAVARDPDFQWALAQAKISYARSGETEDRDILVELLKERAHEDVRNIRQIAIAESVGVIGKITSREVAALGLLFTGGRTVNGSVVNSASLVQYLRRRLVPFVGLLPEHDSSYSHLEFTGCGTVGLGSTNLAESLCERYFGAFEPSFSPDDVKSLASEVGDEFVGALFGSTAPDEDVGPRVRNEQHLNTIAERMKVPEHARGRAEKILTSKCPKGDAAREAILGLVPEMESLLDHWKDTSCGHFSLSSVGLAIGHAEVRRLTGDSSDLAIWLR